MRQERNKQGQMRIIEVLLASFMIMFAISFVAVFAATPNTPQLEVSDLEKMGHSVLLDLDHQGLLVPLVYGQQSQNWSDLRMLLKITLPVDVYFNLTVYKADSVNWTLTAPSTNGKMDTIFYGNEETFGSSRNIASVTYVLTGNQNNYDPRILLLQLSRG